MSTLMFEKLYDWFLISTVMKAQKTLIVVVDALLLFHVNAR